MKNLKILLAIPAIALVFGMTVIGCGNGSTNASGVVSAGLTTKVFESEDDVNRYILSFDAPRSVRAAYTPKYGDSYTLTIIVKASGETKTSSGTVLEVNGATLKLSGGTDLFVTIEVRSGVSAMTAMTGEIKTDDGETLQAPVSLTPKTVEPKSINLTANRWGSGEDQEEWISSIVLSEITGVRPKLGDTYTFKISGTTNKTLERFGLSFSAHPEDWSEYQWLESVSEEARLSGTFEKTFEVFVRKQPNDGYVIQLDLVNGVPVPASASNGEVLAIISNFEIRLIGINLPPSLSDEIFTTTLPVYYDTDSITNMTDAKSRTDFSWRKFDDDDDWETGQLFWAVKPPASVTVRDGNVTISLGTPRWAGTGVYEELTKIPADTGLHELFILATSDSKYYIEFRFGDYTGYSTYGYGYLVYATKDVTVRGYNPRQDFDGGGYSYPTTFNMDFKKGWNYLLYTQNDVELTITASTSLPSGWKWTVCERNW